MPAGREINDKITKAARVSYSLAAGSFAYSSPRCHGSVSCVIGSPYDRHVRRCPFTTAVASTTLLSPFRRIYYSMAPTKCQVKIVLSRWPARKLTTILQSWLEGSLRDHPAFNPCRLLVHICYSRHAAPREASVFSGKVLRALTWGCPFHRVAVPH